MADAFPISGSIDPKAFPYLLMDLHRHGATGSLKVEGPSYQKALYFRSGRVLFGSSNDPRDQLGAILIEMGTITPEQLEDVTGKVGPGNPLAKVLSDTGYVSQRELSDAARAKVESILSDVIAYTSGNFEFEDGVLPKGAIDLKLSTERLVLASVRRLSDRNFVLRHLDGLEVVLAPGADLPARLAELQPEAGGLPEQLDGKRTLKEAAALTRLDEFESAKVACALLFLGLVERRAAAAPEEEPVVHLSDDPLFKMAGGADQELDLGDTARASIESPPAPVSVAMAAAAAPDPRTIEPETPFFIPEDVPPTVIMPPSSREAMAPEPEPEPSFTLPDPVAPPTPPTVIMPAPSEPVAFENDTAPVGRPVAARPSKEDQAALDALLNAPPIQAPAAPSRRPARADTWVPPPSPRPPVRRTVPGPSAVLLGGVTLLLIAAAVGAAWYIWGRTPASAGTRQAARPPVGSLPPVAVTPRPIATATPAAVTPSPLAVTPSPRALAASPAPASATTTTTPRRSAPASLAEARTLLKSGALEQAAQGFAATVKAAPASSASVQILVACSPETVQKAVQIAGSPELFIVPVNYKGRDCYRLCWGLYESESRAASAVRSLPEYFRKAATPRVVAASAIVH